MRQNRNQIAAALTVLLSTGLLFGCGDTQTQTADTRSMVAEQTVAADVDDNRGDLNGDGAQDVQDAQLLLQYYTENTLAGNQQSWDAMLGPEGAARADQAAAYRVLKQYLEACKTGDAKQMMKSSDMSDLVRFADSTLDMEEDLNAEQIDSYTIGEGYTDQEKLVEFQQLVDQVLADMSIAINNTDDKGESAKSMALLLGYMVKPVTKLYVFPVTTTVDGETSSTEMAVTCDDQGEWYVNTGIGVVMYEFLEMAQKSAVNSYAKSVHHAVEASLTEMDEEGLDLSQFNGDFRFSGEEFENVTEPVTTAPAADVLKYRIALFYMEVSKLDEVMIRIQNGTCMAVAIRTNPENGNRIGTYPVCDGIVDDMPLEEALEQATAIY